MVEGQDSVERLLLVPGSILLLLLVSVSWNLFVGRSGRKPLKRQNGDCPLASVFRKVARRALQLFFLGAADCKLIGRTLMKNCNCRPRKEIGEGSAELRFQEPSVRELPRIPSTKETRARPRQQLAFAQKAEPQVAAGKSQGDVSVRFVTDAIRAFERKGSDQKQDDERHSVRFLQEVGQEHSAAREARLRQRHVTGFARSF